MTFPFDKDSDPDGKKFEQWRRSHARWYVLNVKSKSLAMLHKANCLHFDFDKSVNLSKHSKICSEDYRELERWARANGIKKFTRCTTCGVVGPRTLTF